MGDQRKNAEKLPIGFSAFFLWSLLGNYEKKVVEMSSNFERLHKIINQAYPESFIILS